MMEKLIKALRIDKLNDSRWIYRKIKTNTLNLKFEMLINVIVELVNKYKMTYNFI
jgi:hypothetical protein